MTLDRTWYTALVDDAGTGTTGTIWNKARINDFITSIDTELPATVVSVPFNATDYTASGGTWTVAAGNFNFYVYHVLGHLVTVHLSLSSTTVSPAGSVFGVFVKLPAAVSPIAYSGMGLWTAGVGGQMGYIVNSGGVNAQLGIYGVALPATLNVLGTLNYFI